MTDTHTDGQSSIIKLRYFYLKTELDFLPVILPGGNITGKITGNITKIGNLLVIFEFFENRLFANFFAIFLFSSYS